LAGVLTGAVSPVLSRPVSRIFSAPSARQTLCNDRNGSRALSRVKRQRASNRDIRGDESPSLERTFGLLELSMGPFPPTAYERVNLLRDPDAGDPHVRFDERDVETEHD